MKSMSSVSLAVPVTIIVANNRLALPADASLLGGEDSELPLGLE